MIDKTKNPPDRYSVDWYNMIYDDIGTGFSCYRAPARYGRYDGIAEDGILKGCACCRRNLQLNLLPHEEVMFGDMFNETDFRLVNNPRLPGRKAIICSKMGMCGGRSPYVCKTHPVHIVKGLVLVEESLCRLLASTFLVIHRKAVERLRRIIYKYGLEKEVLGYGRRISNNEYIDYER